MRELLGGKGANVAEMTRVLGAERVPAGFTITTEACVAYMEAGRAFPDGLDEQVDEALAAARGAGRQARSATPTTRCWSPCARGARESMPGMLDTVLNLGLNDESVEGLARGPATSASPGTPTGASCRCSATSAAASPASASRTLIEEAKRDAGVKHDVELDVDDLQALTSASRSSSRDETGEEFPQDPREQLRQAIRAVFDSWIGERAVHYRRINRIPDEWGTAVNVQQMVFGNKGEPLVLGRRLLAATRSPARPSPSGDFLVNAQGEDVVSGVRTPRDLARAGASVMPEAHAELIEILRTLERHYGDMQDTEFTVEEGTLYMLQTRNAKRPAQAAVRFAVDAVDEGLLDRAAGARDDRRRHARRAAAPDLRARRRLRGAGARASPPRPAPPRARSCSPPTTPSRAARGRARRDPRAARSPRPTTWPASTPRRASSPPRAARPATRRWSRAGWASRACRGAAALEIDLEAEPSGAGDDRARARAT